MSQSAASAWSTFANRNLKVGWACAVWHDSELIRGQNTNLPIPIPAQGAKPPHQPKTLPHALGRAAKNGATDLGSGDRFGTALAVYGTAMEKVGLSAYTGCES